MYLYCKGYIYMNINGYSLVVKCANINASVEIARASCITGVYNRWTGPVDWTGGLEICGKNVVDLC